MKENSAQRWDTDERARAAALAQQARAHLGADTLPLWAVRAPGRVNLIGEHTDYSGLPVLPAAIDRSTVIVAGPRADAMIELYNADPAYPARRFAVARSIAPFATGDWGNYVKAAVQGVIDHFASRGVEPGRLRGGVMLVDVRVPTASGL
ncbi:MAG: galactokinase family protein, partial [Candidatus Binataceae bacterium]